MPITDSGLRELRGEFPALSQTVDEQPIAFFDGPGGTQVHASVIELFYRTNLSRRADVVNILQ